MKELNMLPQGVLQLGNTETTRMLWRCGTCLLFLCWFNNPASTTQVTLDYIYSAVRILYVRTWPPPWLSLVSHTARWEGTSFP